MISLFAEPTPQAPDPKIFELKTSLGLAALVYKAILKGLGPALFHTLQMLLIVLKAFSDFFLDWIVTKTKCYKFMTQ